MRTVRYGYDYNPGMTHETLPLQLSSTTAIEVGSNKTPDNPQQIIEVQTASPPAAQKVRDVLPVREAELVEEAQTGNAEHNSNLEQLEQAIASLDDNAVPSKPASDPLNANGSPESHPIDRTFRV